MHVNTLISGLPLVNRIIRDAVIGDSDLPEWKMELRELMWSLGRGLDSLPKRWFKTCKVHQ